MVPPPSAPPASPAPEPAAGLAARLASPALAAAVAVLVFNDRVLKPALGNWFTGKLSDVAGLFAFAVFWAALLPRQRGAVCAATAAAWLLWKSPLADAPLALWNGLDVWPLARVADPTDWLALVALAPAAHVARRAARRRPPGRPGLRRLARRVAAAGVGAASVAAFAATSRVPPSVRFADLDGWLVAAPPAEVERGLQAIGLYVVYPPAAPGRPAPDTAARLLTAYVRQPPERDVAVGLELRRVAPDTTQLRLRSASAPGPTPRPTAVRAAVEAQLVEPLRRWAAGRAGPR